MERVDLCLVSPPSRMINHYRPPLSLMYVAQHFRENGKSVKIIDTPTKQVVRNSKFNRDRGMLLKQIRNDMLEQISKVDADEIGISCYSPELEEVTELISMIKVISPAKISVGGIHPTFCPEDFEGIADKVYRGRFDTKLPAYDLVDMDYYTNANPYAIRGVYLRATYVLSSMGCPSQCTFCVAKKLRDYYGVGYIKSPLDLAEEVVMLKNRYDIDGFYIIDDLFTIDKRFVNDFCYHIKETGLLWGCSSKVTTLNSQLIRIMSKAGCIQIDFGVERGSNEALERLKKGQTIEKVKEVFADCKQHKIRTFANFIVNIPEETESDWRDIRGLVNNIRPTVTSINIYRGYYGTELSDNIPTSKVEQEAKNSNRKCNSIFRNLAFTFNFRYWKLLWSNRRRFNYLKQLFVLIQEVINQCLC